MVLLEVVLIPLGLVLLFLLHVMQWPSLRTLRLSNKIHGPRGIPLLGISHQFTFLKNTALLDFLKSLMDKYPRLTHFWVLGIPHVIVQEAEDLEVVMGSVLHISKGIEYTAIVAWLKEGLLTSSGQKWHTRRKMLTNAFHFKILEDALPKFNKNGALLAHKMLEKKGNPIDVESYVKLCTLDVICEAAMGVSLDSQNNQGQDYVGAIKETGEIVVRRILSVWMYRDWMFFINPVGIRFRRLLKVLYDFTVKVINERRMGYYVRTQTEEPQTKKRSAFLDTLLEVEMNNPGLLTQEDIRQEVDTFMFEGHDTTATAIVFTLSLLGWHKDIQDKAYAELYDLFGDSDRPVEKQDLAKMNYLEKVIKESLRLFPSVPYISRTLTHDLHLDGGVLIPSETNVIITPYFIHRNPRFFPDPEKFDPERFSEEGCQKRHPFAYIPFSAGPRNCIGQKFAMMELKIIVASVLRKAEVTTLTRREDIKLVPLLILRPESPISIKITPRIVT